MGVQAAIERFEGEYEFLSNFYYSAIEHYGLAFDTVEHAYQASKTTNAKQRRDIRDCPTPNLAKRLGQKVTMRPDWEQVKLDIMLRLLRKKFAIPALRKKLLATGNAMLVEGNWWGDTFWGVCRGKGENHLGKLLMQVRREIRTEMAA